MLTDVSGGVTSCDDSTWNNCAGWTGAGIIGRSECINAKFITGFCAEKYELYDNKICTGEESAQCKDCLSRRVESVGYRIVTDRGDSRIEK